MNETINMNTKSLGSLILALVFSISSWAQATHVITDAERKYKEAKALFINEQYGLAYPLLKDLQQQYPDNTTPDHTYINDDIRYYYIVCGLKLELPVAVEEADQYIEVVNNQPRRQLMSFHLGKYYFTKDAFSKAIENYERAGLDNLSNEEIANAKFEKGYCYFNLKQFDQARPLFDEVHQLAGNKYYIPANYYHGFIAYYDKKYAEALRAFKLVETADAYKGVVPYYIAEITYFQGKKDEALRYGESVLSRGGLFYEKDLKMLIGQLYFERKNFAKALPLLQYYVDNSDKVTREVLYELSYCHYEAANLAKAIEGFKQLSNEKDSLGQNSMYLLGDCYLRTNQKANARNAFQYCAYNSSNAVQQEISRFNYGKLSYELGYQDIALTELKSFLTDYPNSAYTTEAKEILVSLLAGTSNFADALTLYEGFDKPTANMQKVYPRILYGRAIDFINDQRLDKADELLTKLIALPNAGAVLPYAHFWKGEISYRNGRYDDAIRGMANYLQSNSPALGEATPAAARYVTGYSWMKKENYRNALTAFEQVTTTVSTTAAPLVQDAYVRSADCYFMNRDFAKAGVMYDNVLNNALPQSDYALFQKAMIAGIKSAADKIKILNTLTRQYPQSSLVPDVTMEIANTYMADEKFRDALPALNSLLNNPAATTLRPRTYLKLGLCYYNIDKNKEALDNYQALITQYPESAEADEALDNIKAIYVEEGRPNEYVAFMQRNGKSISVSEADSLTYTAALLKYNAGDCAAAINGFNNYINTYPEGAFLLEAYFSRADCYHKNKDWPNAVSSYSYVTGKGQNRYFEKAALAAARISYFEQKDFATARGFFEQLRTGAINQDAQLEALRGLVRCFYQLKDYTQANTAAKDLLTRKGASTDDRSIAFLVLGKSLQLANNCAEAITAFKSCAAINKAAWGAEARYEMAVCHYSTGNFTAAEKAAMSVIRETGSYDNWVTRSYILLGDIFMQQKDYFNAKATYESVARNAAIPELRTEAQTKLDAAIAAEKVNSKINN
jgi:tetratricopeptide (TPR) repeat protein